MKTYAGIGSRETPPRAMKECRKVAEHLAHLGYTLRSGGADGADTAFEKGCDAYGGDKEIFLPWEGGTNGNKSPLWGVDRRALLIASKFHPTWKALGQRARLLHGRNSYIVLGEDLISPVDFIVCWTPGGREQGGTAQGMRIAKAYNIPIYNLATFNSALVLKEIQEKHA